MKIKIFQSIFERKVEKQVNKFLEQDVEILSVQYSATSLYFSVMISYNESSLEILP